MKPVLWEANRVTAGGDGALSLRDLHADRLQYWHVKGGFNSGGSSFSLDDLTAPKRKETIRDKAVEVEIQPSGHQQNVLNAMIRVSNHAYNWCDHLVTTHNMKASVRCLRNIVASGKHILKFPFIFYFRVLYRFPNFRSD